MYLRTYDNKSIMRLQRIVLSGFYLIFELSKYMKALFQSYVVYCRSHVHSLVVLMRYTYVHIVIMGICNTLCKKTMYCIRLIVVIITYCCEMLLNLLTHNNKAIVLRIKWQIWFSKIQRPTGETGWYSNVYKSRAANIIPCIIIIYYVMIQY